MKFTRLKAFRTGLQASAVSSQPLQNSSTSANNWGGASQTVIELSKEMEVELGQLNTDNLREQRDAMKAMLREKAEMFVNSNIELQKHEDWNCGSDTIQLASIASICAEAVYRPLIIPSIPDYRIDSITSIGASITGGTKPTEIYWVQPLTSTCRSILVVAVRGSAGLVDWVVNSNTHAGDVSGFIDLKALGVSTNSPGTLLCVHRGFLNSARELVFKVIPALESKLAQMTDKLDVLFTGHSAGGAVATLLFAHFLTNMATHYKFLDSTRIRFSCITFGAPPIFATDINAPLKQYIDRSRHGGVISFIAEGDPIPRMDQDYAHFVFRCLLPSEPLTSSTDEGISAKDSALPTLQLPACLLHSMGDTIVMSDGNSNSGEALDLRVKILRKEDLDKYFFVNFFAHKMSIYRSLIAQLALERFNAPN